MCASADLESRTDLKQEKGMQLYSRTMITRMHSLKEEIYASSQVSSDDRALDLNIEILMSQDPETIIKSLTIE